MIHAYYIRNHVISSMYFSHDYIVKLRYEFCISFQIRWCIVFMLFMVFNIISYNVGFRALYTVFINIIVNMIFMIFKYHMIWVSRILLSYTWILEELSHFFRSLYILITRVVWNCIYYRNFSRLIFLVIFRNGNPRYNKSLVSNVNVCEYRWSWGGKMQNGTKQDSRVRIYVGREAADTILNRFKSWLLVYISLLSVYTFVYVY